MNELLQQLAACVTMGQDSSGEPIQIVDTNTAIPLIVQILQQMNNA